MQKQATRGKIALYEVLIFATGAVTLSLEVLASRIMTPYFGVSLYIWTGILSITLAFLAIGYFVGGRIAARLPEDSLERIFLAAPLASALSIAGAVALYPLAFPLLASTSLVFGSFAGGFLLLALPLTALSAMNPILIAIGRGGSVVGDAGAGRIYFISTIGSVAGVLVTAFLFIPNLSNFRASLLLGIALCLAVFFLSLIHGNFSRIWRIGFNIGCSVALLVCGLLLFGQKQYLTSFAEVFQPGLEFNVVGEYSSIFGNIKVVEIRPLLEGAKPILAYLQDGLIQNRTTTKGVSLSPYTYVLDGLSHIYAPGAKKALVLGAGAGILPQDLRRHGISVDLVEINPDSLRAATEFFRFDPAQISLHIEDARTFARRCEQKFDLAIIDLFQGDGTPDYLLTTEFFKSIENCLETDGVAVMNAFLDEENDTPNKRLFATIAEAFPVLKVHYLSASNAVIVAARRPLTGDGTARLDEIPGHLRDLIDNVLRAGGDISREDLAGIPPVADDANVFSVLFAKAEMRLRGNLSRLFPPHVLVN